MVSPERVSSKMQPKYVTLDYCFILISLYWMFGSFHFLIFCLLPIKIDFVLYLPKWIVNLLSTNQPQSILKFLFIADSILIISLCSNIKQVSSAYSYSSQSTACGISFIYKWNRSGPKMDPSGTLHKGFPGSKKVFLLWTLNFLFERQDVNHFDVFSENPINSILQYQKLSVSQLKSYRYKDQIQNLWLFYCLSKIDMNHWRKSF